MAWRVFSFSPAVGRDPATGKGALIRFECHTVWSEREARVRAMRLYDGRSTRVAVRRPGALKPIRGPALEEWLADRLSGAVRD
jgi:hypothetical protein